MIKEDRRPEIVDRFLADLHIHTLLSPCAEVEMIPPLIIAMALEMGLDIIGIADHNSCENARACIEAAEGTGLKVLPGMEVHTAEGVHLLCLFDDVDSSVHLMERVYETLPKIPGNQSLFEKQMIVDADGEFIGFCEQYLSLPCLMEIDEVFELTANFGGICIPSHIDRHEMGICGVLGMVPDEPDFPAVEISKNITPADARMLYFGLRGLVSSRVPMRIGWGLLVKEPLLFI